MNLAQLGQWNDQFLQDIGVSRNYWARDMPFLNAWENREGVGNRAMYNALATTQRESGSYPVNSVGVQGFTSLASGAQANATALENGLYGDLLAAFQGGTLDPNAQYKGLGTWSGGGYTSLTGTSTNPVATAADLNRQANQPQIDALNQQNYLSAAQIAAQQSLATSDITYAKQEEQLQSALLGLSNMQLELQRASLGRQQALAPQMFMLQQAALQDQARLVKEQGWANMRSGISQQAGSGSLFTQGGLAQRQLTKDQYLTQEKAISYTARQEKLQYQEQLAALSDQMKNIEITAARYGISAQELQDRLQNQLQNISTGLQMGDLQLLGGMLSNNAQIAGLSMYSPSLTPYPYHNSGIPTVPGNQPQPGPQG